MTARILIVDDSPIDRRLVEFFLRKGIVDASVSSTDNGQKALDVIISEIPDLIITDLQMPGMNGLEFVEHLQARRCMIPVILLTGAGTQEMAVHALKTGAVNYVPKGGIDKHLVETVKHVLSLSQWQRNPSRGLTTLDLLESHFTLENDASLISPLIAYLQEQLEAVRFSDQLQIIRIGMAIYESLTNAIFQGNLELRQTDEAFFLHFAMERHRVEPYASRRVRLTSRLSGTEACFVVTDDGLGDNPLERQSPTSEMNLEQIGGRGQLLIHSFMDEVTQNSKGNEITMTKRFLP